MLFYTAIGRVRDSLTRPLPGIEAQRAFAPRPPPPTWLPGRYPADARPAAALLLLYPIDDRAHVVLTRRADDLPHHRWQISLPGGTVTGRETIREAALHEAQEEVGVDPAELTVLGTLTPVYIRVSGFVLHPVVASREARPRLRPDAREVARILEIRLEAFADPAQLERERRPSPEGSDIDVPFFNLSGERVWGATAMVLAELLHMLDHPLDPWKL